MEPTQTSAQRECVCGGGSRVFPRPGTRLGTWASALSCHTEPCLQQVAWGSPNTTPAQPCHAGAPVPEDGSKQQDTPTEHPIGPSPGRHGSRRRGSWLEQRPAGMKQEQVGADGLVLGLPPTNTTYLRANARPPEPGSPEFKSIGSAWSSSGNWEEALASTRVHIGTQGPRLAKQGHQGTGHRHASLRAEPSLFPIRTWGHTVQCGSSCSPALTPMPRHAFIPTEAPRPPTGMQLTPNFLPAPLLRASKTHRPARHCPSCCLSRLAASVRRAPVPSPEHMRLGRGSITGNGGPPSPLAILLHEAGNSLYACGSRGEPRERLAQAPRAHAAPREHPSRAGWPQFLHL